MRIFPEMWANTWCPLFNSTLNMALGSGSTTEPSISMVSPFFAISLQGRGGQNWSGGRPMSISALAGPETSLAGRGGSPLGRLAQQGELGAVADGRERRGRRPPEQVALAESGTAPREGHRLLPLFHTPGDHPGPDLVGEQDHGDRE